VNDTMELLDVTVGDVTCGLGNVFYNKGAIGAFVTLKRKPAGHWGHDDTATAPKQKPSVTKLLLVSAHMAAHAKHVEARNDDYWRIVEELTTQAPSHFLPQSKPVAKPPTLNIEQPPKQGKRKKRRRKAAIVPAGGAIMDMDEEHTNAVGKNSDASSRLMDSADHVFFAGDLNYRIELPRERTEHTIRQIERLKQQQTNQVTTHPEELEEQIVNLFQELLKFDQLHRVMYAAGSNKDVSNAFPGFREGKINFLPTFKFDKRSKEYDTSHKQRIPSWTDRILYKSRYDRGSSDSSDNGCSSGIISVLDYRSIPDAVHSDHRPVIGTYRIDF